MAKEETHKITQKGLETLKEELIMRTELKRPQLREVIEDMRDKGDLSENDGYTLALEDNESNELRIGELEYLIDNAEVVESIESDEIIVGSKVKVKLKEKHVEYEIVGHSEANPIENKISEETPIGKALLGKKPGDTVTVNLPVGEVEYEVIEIL